MLRQHRTIKVGERKFGPEREPETSVPIVARPEKYGLTAEDVVIVVGRASCRERV